MPSPFPPPPASAVAIVTAQTRPSPQPVHLDALRLASCPPPHNTESAIHRVGTVSVRNYHAKHWQLWAASPPSVVASARSRATFRATRLPLQAQATPNPTSRLQSELAVSLMQHYMHVVICRVLMISLLFHQFLPTFGLTPHRCLKITSIW